MLAALWLPLVLASHQFAPAETFECVYPSDAGRSVILRSDGTISFKPEHRIGPPLKAAGFMWSGGSVSWTLKTADAGTDEFIVFYDSLKSEVKSRRGGKTNVQTLTCSRLHY